MIIYQIMKGSGMNRCISLVFDVAILYVAFSVSISCCLVAVLAVEVQSQVDKLLFVVVNEKDCINCLNLPFSLPLGNLVIVMCRVS